MHQLCWKIWTIYGEIISTVIFVDFSVMVSYVLNVSDRISSCWRDTTSSCCHQVRCRNKGLWCRKCNRGYDLCYCDNNLLSGIDFRIPRRWMSSCWRRSLPPKSSVPHWTGGVCVLCASAVDSFCFVTLACVELIPRESTVERYVVLHHSALAGSMGMWISRNS